MSIRLPGISKTYGDQAIRVEALKSIGLQIEQGEFVCLWGASGSGKSTLLNILGLLDAADSGVYTLEGADVAGLSDVQRTHLRSKRIGFGFLGFSPVEGNFTNVYRMLEDQVEVGEQLGHMVITKQGFYRHGAADPEKHSFTADELAPIRQTLAQRSDVSLVSPRLGVNGLVSNVNSLRVFIAEAIEPADLAALRGPKYSHLPGLLN